METVNDIITDALEDLVIKADEAPIEPSEAKTAIRTLNRMMHQFASKGINLGYTEVNSLDDEITVPLGAMDGIVSNLAMRLAPKYLSSGVPATLALAAEEGYNTLLRIAIQPGYTRYPDTLPIGSGNKEYNGNDTNFYPAEEPTVESEQSGSISLESSTEEA